MGNSFKPISITYDSVLRDISAKLAADSRFANFRESANAQVTNEIFASVVDLVLFYLERRSEEVYLETCKIRGSAILLARQLGYVVTRAIPSEATVKLYFKDGSLITTAGLMLGDKIQIPLHAVFSYSGNNYILKKYFSHTLIQQDIDGITAGNYYITTDDDGATIDIVQGDIKEKVIASNTNPQVGQKFQVYKIDDTTFSNKYGSEDYNPPVTRVWVGNNKEREFTIDRRSLLNWDSIANFDTSAGTVSGSNVNMCLLRSTQEEDMELVFGDGGFAAFGAQSTNDNVYVQYLSTIGSKANKVGVIGKDITFSGKVYDNNGNSLANYMKFQFNSNITLGADTEDIESIKQNATAIFYTLDRLVTKKDYINYLKSVTSPFKIKNALAWGEQEECRATGAECIQSLFNVVLFSCLGELYQVNSSPCFPYTDDTGIREKAILDDDYEDNSIVTSNSYFNMYSKNNTVGQLKEYDNTNSPYWVLAASAAPTLTTWTDFHTTVGDVIDCRVYYTSEKYGTSLSASYSDINIYLSAVSSTATSATMFNNFAFQIQTALRSMVDLRGTTINNSNYNSVAFSTSTVCSFNTTTGMFTISGSPYDACYVTKAPILIDYIEFDTLSLGNYPKKYYKQLNANVVDLINNMNKRSEVTVKNVYITPLIQNFNINGTVYVNPLFDKAELKVDIEDAIYKWLNLNADFGVEIYKSNVVEIIEGFDGVKYADIKFVPEILRANDNASYFYTSANSHITNYSNKNDINTAIMTELTTYLSGGYVGTSALTLHLPENTENTFEYYTHLLQNYTFGWNANFTERTFLTKFVKNTYNRLISNSAMILFANSEDFTGVMSDIHKDLLYIIRNNMIDSNGNIAKEERNGKLFKGGFTMGMEVVKLTCNMQYEYK